MDVPGASVFGALVAGAFVASSGLGLLHGRAQASGVNFGMDALAAAALAGAALAGAALHFDPPGFALAA